MSKVVRRQKNNSVKYSVSFTCIVLLEAKFARTVDEFTKLAFAWIMKFLGQKETEKSS